MQLSLMQRNWLMSVYKIIIYWSEDDWAFIAEVTELLCC